MTDMVFGSVAQQPSDPILPRWWQTIDRWSLTFVMILFIMGILLGLAASVPLAQRNGLDPFYYVYKQLFFGIIALLAMIFTSMLSPKVVRRLGIIGFICCFIAICFLPFLGTDYGKGAVRWYSLGFASVQPSEFLKPCFVIFTAWLMASSFEVGGPPGKRMSFLVCVLVVGLLAFQPDFGQASLFLASWGLMYFVAGASLILMFVMFIGVIGVGLFSYNNSKNIETDLNKLFFVSRIIYSFLSLFFCLFVYLFFSNLYIAYYLIDVLSKGDQNFMVQFRNVYLFFFILCSVRTSYMYLIINISKIDAKLGMDIYNNTKEYFM